MNLAGSELNKFVSERCVKVLGAKELELESWRDREDREKEVKLAQLQVQERETASVDTGGKFDDTNDKFDAYMTKFELVMAIVKMCLTV